MVDDRRPYHARRPADQMTQRKVEQERQELSELTRQLAGGRGRDGAGLDQLRARRSELAFELVRRALLQAPYQRRNSWRDRGMSARPA